MAMGHQGDRQGDLMMTWAELPRSPGHAFYDRVQGILVEAEEVGGGDHARAYLGRGGVCGSVLGTWWLRAF